MNDNDVHARPRRVSGWLIPLACVVLLVAAMLAPITAPFVAAAIVAAAIHHAICMAKTDGSPAPFAALLGLDILMIVLIVGLLVTR
ncbi:hypothetical protein ITJ43_14570 [Microbacterium sp. VKM Ac-2870]|uniref:hypothetical protein n=1 Tax=Microbacterium sp. VKM Ac-2870 TaxID=2783825 RepID=UPI00188D6810|nr:hypothetical protein [Microbacterium sp. VKM Ac-2870]MBF4563353.1 hypothetical protein [Microbacterium sp. VKM Ac-2870]